MMGSLRSPFRLFFVVAVVLLRPSLSQQQQAAAPPPAVGCNGVLLSYSLDGRERIRPFLTDPAAQPYKFTATATVLNSGLSPLLSWSLLVAFAHREVIVSVGNAVLTDGSDLPYNTTVSAGHTSFSGFPTTDLKTAIATAGDINQIQAQIPIVGTLFGSPPPAIPLPSNLSLDDPSFLCPAPALGFNTTTLISTCCVPNPAFKANTTSDPLAGAGNSTGAGGPYLSRRTGDLTISYDVIQAYTSSYLALVTIANQNPLGRLDNWHLSWQWMRGEFIFSMKGAYTTIGGANDCIYGPQGQYYQSLDFSTVANCQRRPTILDLPLYMANDTNSGRIPLCCRNGTLLPGEMDPTQSSSAFQLQVFKMPPDLNRTKILPPQNWKIAGAAGSLNPDYLCGPPIRVAPSEFPGPSNLQSDTLAIASWQVVCNITVPKSSSPRCCVSFSSYYNESVVPCKTCACGCPTNRAGPTCNATAAALLLPPQALLVPFSNRTDFALEWARQKHFAVPNPVPCGDNCGVSINWHINSDYTSGWTSRITLFNWEEVSFADWFVAVELAKAYDGYESMYSFNGTAMGNSTIFMQGLPGLNYLVGEVDGDNPSTDPRVPGKQQSVISFTKKTTPDINIAAGDGFPTKVFFNGEECSLPDRIPTGRGFRSDAGGVFSLLLVLVATALVMLEQ